MFGEFRRHGEIDDPMMLGAIVAGFSLMALS